MTMNLRAKVPKSKLGTRARGQRLVATVAQKSVLHLAAHFMKPDFEIDRAPSPDEMLWFFNRLVKSTGHEMLNSHQIKFLKDYCALHGLEPWFDR